MPANPRKSPLYPPFIKGGKLIGITPSHPPFLKASGSESLRLGEGIEGDFVEGRSPHRTIERFHGVLQGGYGDPPYGLNESGEAGWMIDWF